MNKMLSILSVYKNSSHNPDFIGFINDDIVKATFVLIKILNKKKTFCWYPCLLSPTGSLFAYRTLQRCHFETVSIEISALDLFLC